MDITPPVAVPTVASAEQPDPEDNSPLANLSTPENLSPVQSHDDNDGNPIKIERCSSPPGGGDSQGSSHGEEPEQNSSVLSQTQKKEENGEVPVPLISSVVGSSPRPSGAEPSDPVNHASNEPRATSDSISSSNPHGSGEPSGSNDSTERNPSETPQPSMLNENGMEGDSSELQLQRNGDENNPENDPVLNNGVGSGNGGDSVHTTELEQTGVITGNGPPESHSVATSNHEPGEGMPRSPSHPDDPANPSDGGADSSTEPLHIANLFATPNFPRSALTRPTGPRFSARFRPSSSSATSSPNMSEPNNNSRRGNSAEDEASASRANNGSGSGGEVEGESVGNSSEGSPNHETPGQQCHNTELQNSPDNSPSILPGPADGDNASYEGDDESSSSSSSPSSGCTSRLGHKRRSGDDTDEDRPQGGDLFFYDTKRPSAPVRPPWYETKPKAQDSGSGRGVGFCFLNRIKANVTNPAHHSLPSTPKRKRSCGDGDIPGLYGSPKRPRLNYDWYEQYHQLGQDCLKAHRCTHPKFCHECHAKWQKDWDEFFRVEDEHLVASEEGLNNEINPARQDEEAGTFQGPESVYIKTTWDPPKGFKMRTHPARLAKQMRLKK